jgi:hypothetical protein
MSTPLDIGIHYGVSAKDYHADPCLTPSLSSGVLRTILSKSIEHAALEHPKLGGESRESTPAMGLGSIVHALMAGDDSEMVVGMFDSYRSKAAQEWRDGVEASGKTAALERDLDDARPIVRALFEKAALGVTNTPFAEIGRNEVTAIWREGDAYCRARYDRLVVDPSGYADIWDWKTTREIGEREIMRAIVDMGYHIQAAFYMRGLSACLPEYAGRISFVFVFVETSPPYQVRRVTLSPAFLAIANRDVNEGIAKWKHALANNDFAAPAFGTLQIEPPAYLCDDDIINVSE